MTELREKLKAAEIRTYPLNIPIDAEDRRVLREVGRALWEAAEHECYCDGGTCSEDDPCCGPRKARKAYKALVKLLLPEHRSLNPDRLGHPPEAIYLRIWQKEQEREHGINGGFGLLELLLAPTRMSDAAPRRCIGDPPLLVPPVSQRDAEVAATVVQWLGTNCGQSFMFKAEREIEQARVERSNHDWCKAAVLGGERVLPREKNLASHVASQFCRADDKRYAGIVEAIEAALIQGRTFPEEPEWTTEVPKLRGWYWWKEDPESRALPCWVGAESGSTRRFAHVFGRERMTLDQLSLTHLRSVWSVRIMVADTKSWEASRGPE